MGGLLSSFSCRPRILYASTFVWLTCVGGRFLSPFLEHDAGLSSEQIGTALALQQLSITVFSWMGGIWADRLSSANNTNTNRSRNRNRLVVIGLGVTVSTIAFVLHGLHHITNRISNNDAALSSFWKSVEWHYILQAIYGAAIASVFPVLDGITIDYCKNKNSSSSYGKERLYGPIFWAIASLSLSPLLDQIGFIICYPLAILSTIIVYATLLGFYNSNNYNNSYDTSASTIGSNNERNGDSREFTIVSTDDEDSNNNKTDLSDSNYGNDDYDINNNAIVLPNSNEDYLEQQQQEEEADCSSSSLKALLYSFIFTTGGSAAFLFCLVCISSGQAIVDNLSFLFFESNLGSSWLVLGLSVVVKILFELPVFYYDTYLLTKYGNRNILLLGCSAYIIRVIAYTWIPSTTTGILSSILLWLLEPLHGITYGAVQVAMVDFASKSLPPGMEATGQGFVYFFREVGGILGVGIGGWGLKVGAKGMFRIMAGIVLVGSLCVLLNRPGNNDDEEESLHNNGNNNDHHTIVSFGLEQQQDQQQQQQQQSTVEYHQDNNIWKDTDTDYYNSITSSDNIPSISKDTPLREIT